jgi:predicted Rossmann fold flavoprotein
LQRYTPLDFLALVEGGGVSWCERERGQLFCKETARDIVNLLLDEMRAHGVVLRLGAAISLPNACDGGFELTNHGEAIQCAALVVATGGRSIPKMGASGFGYAIAARFGLRIVETRPALTPLLWAQEAQQRFGALAGVSLPVRVACGKTTFEEPMVFTHRGVSGPGVLQISSYWREGLEVEVDLAPGVPILADLRQHRACFGRQSAQTALARRLPRRLAQVIAAEDAHSPMAALSDEALVRLADHVGQWRFKPAETEGYRTAEVTLGGVDTKALDQRTFEARSVPGLHFIGEVVDVTGWLGGYNFQWAWSSGWCAGQVV